MGLNNLTLVSPREFLSDTANAKAVGCIDILENANVVENYNESLSRSSLVVGFSARSRKSNIPHLLWMNQLEYSMITLGMKFIVFGNEQSVSQMKNSNFVTILYQYLLTTVIHL